MSPAYAELEAKMDANARQICKEKEREDMANALTLKQNRVNLVNTRTGLAFRFIDSFQILQTKLKNAIRARSETS